MKRALGESITINESQCAIVVLADQLTYFVDLKTLNLEDQKL